MNAQVALAGLLYFVAAGVLAYVGQRIGRRPVSAEAQFAAVEFSSYWFGLCLGTAGSGLEMLLANAGILSLTTALTIYLFSLLLDTVVLAGLVGYLVYVYTGKYHLWALGLFYASFYIAALDWVIGRVPVRVDVNAAVPSVGYHYVAASAGPLFGFVVLGLLIPPFAALVAYLSLLRRTRNPALRYRILLVGSSIFLWFGMALFTPSSPSPAPDAWTFITPIVDILSAVLGLVAFFPPAWVRRRVEAEPSTISAPTGTEAPPPSQVQA